MGTNDQGNDDVDKSSPADLVAIVNKVKALAKESQYKAAIVECDKYFRYSQSEPEGARAAVQRLYGYCFLKAKDFQRAIEELTKVLRTESADRDTLHLAYSNLGNAYENIDQYPEALRNYQESLKYATNEDDRRIVEIFIRYLPK